MNEMKSAKKETNRERFIRIAERRVNIVLKNLESLGKCSNKRNYEYSDADIKKIFSEIDNKTREIKEMFGRGKKNNKIFRL